MGDGAENGTGPRVVLLGPPGAGKGTQAHLLCLRLGVPAISTGDMLRQAVANGSALGKRVDKVMASGELVDDGLMAEVVRERLARPDAQRGYLLDGYPRTLPQAETLAGIPGQRLVTDHSPAGYAAAIVALGDGGGPGERSSLLPDRFEISSTARQYVDLYRRLLAQHSS